MVSPVNAATHESEAEGSQPHGLPGLKNELKPNTSKKTQNGLGNLIL